MHVSPSPPTLALVALLGVCAVNSLGTIHVLDLAASNAHVRVGYHGFGFGVFDMARVAGVKTMPETRIRIEPRVFWSTTQIGRSA